MYTNAYSFEHMLYIIRTFIRPGRVYTYACINRGQCGWIGARRARVCKLGYARCIWSAPGAPSVSLPDLHISRVRVFIDRRLHVDHPGDLQHLRAHVLRHERLSMRASAPVRV
jgi:hypothetical protein